MISNAAEDLVAEFIQKEEPGAMVTKFVLLVEVIDSEGNRCIIPATDKNSTTWDILGMLHYGILKEEGQTIIEEMDDDDDDPNFD